MSRLAKLMKLRLVDYSCPDKYDSDFDSDSDDSSSRRDKEIIGNDADISSMFALRHSTKCEFSIRLIRTLLLILMIQKNIYINKRLPDFFLRISILCLLIVSNVL